MHRRKFGVFWLGVAAMLIVSLIVDYAAYKRYEKLINPTRKKYEKTLKEHKNEVH